MVVLVIGLAELSLAVYNNQHLIARSSKYNDWTRPAYHYIPTTLDDHEIEEYEEVALERSYRFTLRLFCLQGDPRLCLFFDEHGVLAGCQISYPIRRWRMNRRIYNMSNSNFINTNYFNIPAKSVRIYFTNPADGICKTSPELVEGLWTEYNDGRLVKYDRKCQPNSPVIGDFDMIGCGPEIGQIFVQGLSDSEVCEENSHLFMLYENEKLIGFGHLVPGIVARGPKVNIYNYPNRTSYEELLPNPTPCFQKLAPYGLTIVGFWFIEDPWYIRCHKCHCA